MKEKMDKKELRFFLRHPIRTDIIGLLQKNGEMTQRAIALKLDLWDEHCRYHVDALIKVGVLSVRYNRGDHQGGIDKLVRIADDAEKILKALK